MVQLSSGGKNNVRLVVINNKFLPMPTEPPPHVIAEVSSNLTSGLVGAVIALIPQIWRWLSRRLETQQAHEFASKSQAIAENTAELVLLRAEVVALRSRIDKDQQNTIQELKEELAKVKGVATGAEAKAEAATQSTKMFTTFIDAATTNEPKT